MMACMCPGDHCLHPGAQNCTLNPAENADPPMGMLICDPPPGRITMLFYPGKLDIDTIERFRAQWNDAMRSGSVIVMPEGWSAKFAGSPGWPDWEFCAA